MVITLVLYRSTMNKESMIINTVKDIKPLNHNIDRINKNATIDMKQSIINEIQDNNPLINPQLFKSPNKNIEQKNDTSILLNKNQTMVNDKLLQNISIDSNDIFGHGNNLRQFYTIPNNDQGSFIDWCYRNNNFCKDGISKDCTGYE